MKIIYIVHDFFPRFYGGTERYVLNISKQLQRMGHSVNILTYGIEEPEESFSKNTGNILQKTYYYENLEVVSIRHTNIPFDIGFRIEDKDIEDYIYNFLLSEGPDIVHIAHPMRMAAALKATKRTAIPVILTITDFWLLCPRGRFYKPDYTLCNSPEAGKKCIRECAVNPYIIRRYQESFEFFKTVDLRISPSRFLIEIFNNNQWNNNIIHINHGVDYNFVNPLKKNEPSDEVVFGYIGVVSRFKGVDLLIKAFMDVDMPNIKLKIYGNCLWYDNFKEELQQATSLDKRIILMGKYDHGELSQVMQDIDIMVVPSSTLESYGLVVVESLAYGVPVIASDIVGSAYEYITNGFNGYIFNVNKPDELSYLIKKISSDKSIISVLKDKITPPPRLEEEVFYLEKLYKTLIKKQPPKQ